MGYGLWAMGYGLWAMGYGLTKVMVELKQEVPGGHRARRDLRGLLCGKKKPTSIEWATLQNTIRSLAAVAL
ncbi:hypothetical protein RJ45_02395 [Photobacterium gaetbulicola]|uniref:Uncharacterized protein n=1 Tax=Photobacterium gaetbulicola TaxID=1295392 RepID=A0A0B9GK84_9GAMM|nr:hypothetical protein RJ45_02395 [Photobacterium gaetbulicola]